MLKLILISLLFLWLDSGLRTLPLFLIIVSAVVILRYHVLAASLAFFGGMILDISFVRSFGITGLFLIGWIFFILLYDKKYEIHSYFFVTISSFFGSLIYMLVFGYKDILFQSVICAILSMVLFSILKVKRNQSYEARHPLW